MRGSRPPGESDLLRRSRLSRASNIRSSPGFMTQARLRTEQGIIHRDLKPSNIMVERDGTPRLLDFGIAKELDHLNEAGQATRLGLRFLSPDYAAPEWAREGIAGTAADVYSLGAILRQMLTGPLPVKGGRNSAAAWDELDVICLKAMRQEAD